MKTDIEIDLDVSSLDVTMEKANRLVELLREAQQIIDSLFEQERSKSDAERKGGITNE